MPRRESPAYTPAIRSVRRFALAITLPSLVFATAGTAVLLREAYRTGLGAQVVPQCQFSGWANVCDQCCDNRCGNEIFYGPCLFACMNAQPPGGQYAQCDGCCPRFAPQCQNDGDCDDDNACTTDTCSGGSCEHELQATPQCACSSPDTQVVCGEGVPQTPDSCDENPANDACNGTDPTSGIICCAPGACGTAENGAAICVGDDGTGTGGAAGGPGGQDGGDGGAGGPAGGSDGGGDGGTDAGTDGGDTGGSSAASAGSNGSGGSSANGGGSSAGASSRNSAAPSSSGGGSSRASNGGSSVPLVAISSAGGSSGASSGGSSRASSGGSSARSSAASSVRSSARSSGGSSRLSSAASSRISSAGSSPRSSAVSSGASSAASSLVSSAASSASRVSSGGSATSLVSRSAPSSRFSSVRSGTSSSRVCLTDADCPSGTRCVTGRCEIPSSASRASSSYLSSRGSAGLSSALSSASRSRLSASSARGCTADWQCPSGECEDGVCTQRSSAGVRASSRSSVIPVGGACLGNECALGGDLFCAAQGRSCTVTPDFPCIVCGGTLSSSAVSSRVPVVLVSSSSSAFSLRPPVLGCRDAADCAPGAICTAGSCNPCTGNEQCRSGVCAAGVCTDLSCVTHLDCAAGERCVDGACLEPAIIALQPAFCGNARIDPGEECDDGAENADRPNAFCRRDCTPGRCGDGVLDTPLELCDDGNIRAGDGCSQLCQPERTAPQTTVPAQVIELPFTEPVRVAQEPVYQQADAYIAPVTPAPPAQADTGPAALAVMAAGAAAGYGWVRRRRE